jgi:hypothetical protein
MKITKKSFVLIEVLLAITLISIAAFPLLSHPAKVYKQELLLLQQRELERTFENVFFDLISDLNKHLSFEDISSEGSILSLGRYTVNLGDLGTYPYNAHCLVKNCYPNIEEPSISNKLISIEIALTPKNKKSAKPKPVTYLLHIKKEKKTCF